MIHEGFFGIRLPDLAERPYSVITHVKRRVVQCPDKFVNGRFVSHQPQRKNADALTSGSASPIANDSASVALRLQSSRAQT